MKILTRYFREIISLKRSLYGKYMMHKVILLSSFLIKYTFIKTEAVINRKSLERLIHIYDVYKSKKDLN